MQDRSALARDDSDTAYFFDLLYLGESVIKFLVIELLAGIQDDRDSHRYSLEYRLLRADGIGGWAELLDEALTGPSSQHLVSALRDSQQSLTTKWPVSDAAWQRKAVDYLNEVCRLVDPSHENLSRQRVALRQWVREFAWLRNRTRGHGAPKGARISPTCSLLQESIDVIVENAPAFHRSWAYLRRNLSGKYRVSSLGGDRKPFEYLTRSKESSIEDGCYIFLDTPRRTPLLFTEPDLTDFFVPNGNFKGGSFEVLSYISDETRTEDGSAWLLATEARPASETAAKPNLEVVGNVLTNMPPQPEGYIRRAGLESELASKLEDTRHPVITLQGRGGVGKTSLALHVLHEIALGADFFSMIWFSARDIDLLPQGPRIVKADILSTDDVARDFTRLMRPTQLPSTRDAHSYFTQCLSGQADDGPFIFVLDNFETIRDPAELYAYLNNAVRLPNKVLITTRTRDFKADYPIEISGMNRDEFSELVRETALRLQVSTLIDSQYEDDIFEESDGHPYIAKVLLGEVARAGKQIKPKRVFATRESMLDALFERSFATLSPAAQRVFLTLCNWRSLVPKIGLEAVLFRAENERIDVERAISELEKTSLLEILGDVDNGNAFLSVPLAAALFGKRKLVTSPLKLAIDADLDIIHGFGPVATTDIARGIGPRIERMARAAASRSESGEAITQEISVIQYIATEYFPAWLTLADLQEQQLGDQSAAIQSVSRYLESVPDDENAWKHLIRLYTATGSPIAEMNARLQFVELGRPAFSELSYAAIRLNGMLARRAIDLDATEKRLLVQRLRSLLEERISEADATDLSRLAWLCMHEHDLSAAMLWVTKGLEIDPANEHCQSLKRKLIDGGVQA